MFTFAPVTRRKAKLRLALTGVSGAGKTLGALYIAYGMTNDWGKIALIDTEHERAQFYADRSDLGTGSFLYAAFEPPYSTERYKAAVTEAAKIVGADGVVIIDSLSHAWAGSGGVLEVKDRIAQGRGQNSYTAWNEAGKLQNQLIDTILAVNWRVYNCRFYGTYSIQILPSRDITIRRYHWQNNLRSTTKFFINPANRTLP